MISIRGLVKVFNKGKDNELTVLNDMNLEVNDGEMICIMGKSGEGKTTLLNIIAGIEDFNDGVYLLDDVDISNYSDNKMSELRNTKFGMVRQDFALVEKYSVYENVAMPLYVSKMNGKKIKNSVKNTLECTGMLNFAEKEVRKLSGGQKQRVAIARAIVNEPEIILADEPTGALDSETSAEIMNLLKSINRKGKTIIIVTHDNTVAECCDRIVKLENGKNG